MLALLKVVVLEGASAPCDPTPPCDGTPAGVVGASAVVTAFCVLMGRALAFRNFAETVMAPVIVTVHVRDVEEQPLLFHPRKLLPALGVAVSVTNVP